jgi:hypothetical protein
MKVASAAMPHLYLPAWPRQTGPALYRMAGVAIAIAVPTLFWTSAIALAMKFCEVVIAPPALTAFGATVAAWCLVGAALVMGNRG